MEINDMHCIEVDRPAVKSYARYGAIWDSLVSATAKGRAIRVVTDKGATCFYQALGLKLRKSGGFPATARISVRPVENGLDIWINIANDAD